MAGVEEKQYSIRSNLRKFGESTSLKGVSRVLKSRTVFIRVLWFIAIICGLGFALYQLSTLIWKYFQYHTSANVAQKNTKPDFPDLTVCNVNPLTAAHKGYMNFEMYLQILLNLRNKTKDVVNKAGGRKSQFSEIYSHLTSLTGYFENFPYTTKDDLKVRDLNHLLISCKYYTWDWSVSSIDCAENVTTLFWTPNFNVCFQLSLTKFAEFETNTELNNSVHKNMIRGVTFILYLDDFGKVITPTYNHDLLHSKSSGVRLVVHSPKTLPDVKNGINVAPGYETTLHVRVDEGLQQPPPYSDCKEMAFLNSSDRVTDEMHRPLYTQDTCMSLCHQHMILKRCKCLSSTFIFKDDDPKSAPFCGNFSAAQYVRELFHNVTFVNKINHMNLPFDVLEDYFFNHSFAERLAENEDLVKNFKMSVDNLLCVSRADLEVDQAESGCQCPQSCVSRDYSMSISQAHWPHESYRLAFYCEYIHPNKNLRANFENIYKGSGLPTCRELYSGSFAESNVLKKLDGIDAIRSNFLQLNILFPRAQVTSYDEEPSMTWDTLFSNVGGTLNLWVGITFITFVELFELFFEILAGLFSSQNKVEDRKEREEQQQRQRQCPPDSYTRTKVVAFTTDSDT